MTVAEALDLTVSQRFLNERLLDNIRDEEHQCFMYWALKAQSNKLRFKGKPLDLVIIAHRELSSE